MLIEPANTRQKQMVPLPVARLCNEIEDLAIREGLPGRTSGKKAAGPPGVGAGGEPKTGWAAPSVDVLRLALEELPNNPGGPFENRQDWVDIAYAVKGAAVAGGFEGEGREAFLQWSAQWGGDPEEPGRVWDSIVRAASGWGALMRTLERVNPTGAARVKEAAARAAFAAEAAANRAAIISVGWKPARDVDPTALPPRRWLYGKVAIAGFLSVLSAPGGVGKSSLIWTRAVAAASGHELIDGERPIRPLRVVVHCGEDSLAEAERHLAATLKHFGLTHADLGGRLFLSSGRDLKLKVAQMGARGAEPVPGGAEAIVEMMKSDSIDWAIFDPLAVMHGVPENDNTAMNVVVDLLRRIADQADAAVTVLHHTSKGAALDMDAAGAGAVRGASALVDGARIVETVIRMTAKEASRFGIPDDQRRSFLRIEGAKLNLTPADKATWVRLVSIRLDNGKDSWPNGDALGVAERWTPPAHRPGTAADLARVQAALMASPRPPRADQRSPEWIGWLVARELGLDMGAPSTPKEDRTPDQATALARVRAIVVGWVQSGGLVERMEKDPDRRKEFFFVFAGQPAVVLDEDAAESPCDTDGAEDDE